MQPAQLGPAGFEYGRAREWMTAEVNAAIEGARANQAYASCKGGVISMVKGLAVDTDAPVSRFVQVMVLREAVTISRGTVENAAVEIAQQLDSMFVTPLVYQKTVSLHPIVTLTAVIVGSQLLGIVGAFLAVPMVAVGWAVYNALEPNGSQTPVALPTGARAATVPKPRPSCPSARLIATIC